MHFFSYLFFIFSICASLFAATERADFAKIGTDYFLPITHPLSHQITSLFRNPSVFDSAENLRKAGFTVIEGHRQLLIGWHPTTPQYLYKKFLNSRSQNSQYKNFMMRLQGADTLRTYIAKHSFKHLVVPKKWLYQLPAPFSTKKQPNYILIVENMDIYNDWDNPNGEARRLYYNMDRDVLTELCTILHDIEGCDAFPRNQPFTRSGKIAFIDTEHVGRLKGHFLKHIVPALNPELQEYAIALWNKLEQD